MLPAMLVVLLLSFLLFSLLPSSHSQTCSSVNVSFTSTAVSPPIPSDFISFSIEVDVVLEWTGRSATTPRPQFTAFMKQLGRPTIRVGGDSTDYSWWNPDGRPMPPYTTRPFHYNITALDVHSVVNGVMSYGGQATFGINFRNQGNAQWAVEHMRGIDAAVGINHPAILAYEIGNEVDLYPGNEDRPRDWSPAEYYQEWEYYYARIREAVPNIEEKRLQAGAYCCYNQFEDDMKTFVPRDYRYMTTFSIHEYPDNTDRTTTLSRQLSDSISQQAARLITNGTKSGNLVSLLGAHNISLVIGEGNSNSEPGELGVCDVFAGSAIWAIDTFFELARVGLRRFHVHSHEADLRSPIFFENPPERGHSLPWVRPLWYGLRFFAMMKEGEPTILDRALTCTVDPSIKTWAVQTTDGTLRVAVIHKGLNATRASSVFVDLSGIKPAPPATMYLVRLLGTPLQKENITLAGQTWTGTTDGLPLGTFAQEEVQRGADGKYEVVIQPISAAILSSIKFVPFSLDLPQPPVVAQPKVEGLAGILARGTRV